MKIAGIQLDSSWHAPEEVLRRASRLLEEAARDEADLVVLPEMFATGFTMDLSLHTRYQDMIDQWLRTNAKALRVGIIGGIAHVDGDGHGRNCAHVHAPDGRLLTSYTKIHPFSLGEEHRTFTPGDRIVRFTFRGVGISLFICYDLRFPEVFRPAAPTSDLMIVIASWPAARRTHWKTLLAARAIENQCYVLGVNRVGEGGGLAYAGDSQLLGPEGECLGTAPNEKEGMLIGTISPEIVTQIRKKFPFLADRHPEGFAFLESDAAPHERSDRSKGCE